LGYLRINKLNYSGNLYHYESPVFDQDIILIEGDNGTGKTTFCNLIYYALGGRVTEFLRDEKERHKEITGDKDNFVELYVSISGESYQIIRFIDDGDVTITPYKVVRPDLRDDGVECEEGGEFRVELDVKSLKILPVNRSQSNPEIFSDWLLGRLGISVVDIYQGIGSFKINSADLFRLIYMDQRSDTKQIYKRPDKKDNYVSDSMVLRRAIFELLVGKSFSEYYDAIINTKLLEKQKNVANGLLQEYKRLASELSGSDAPRNITFLASELTEKEQQLEKLHGARLQFKRNRSVDSALESTIASTKETLIRKQLELSESKEELVYLLDEKYKLAVIRENAIREIDQVSKIIHSHDQLNLFSSDSCPYCLNKVDRTAGHCVCGSEIDEVQYERFSYTSFEYKNILKSKMKSFETIGLAITDCNSDILDVKRKISEFEAELPLLSKNLHTQLSGIDEPIDLETINSIDDKILDLREDLSRLHQLIDIESRLNGFQKDFDDKRAAYQKSELGLKRLDAQVKIDISEKVTCFSDIYKKLMTETLAECRTARINSDTYLPVLDEGEYKEHSSGVSMRLMYYLTLLQMSLDDTSMPFPRFLLIDTPETAGIELDKLRTCLGKIEEIKKDASIDFQVILTTGLQKYPPELEKYRVMYLPDKSQALLKLR